jgi:membrane protease YdiL (CAAX protease family)
MKHKKMEIPCMFIVTFLVAFLYLSGMPFSLFEMTVRNKDIPFDNAFYVVNTLFLSILLVIFTKVITKNWIFGFSKNNLIKNIWKNGKVFLFGILVVFILGIFSYKPLNRKPFLEEIIVWVLFSNFFIAIIEELLLRGLLFKLFEKIFKSNIMLAIIVSSTIFGIGHIPGMIQENWYTITIRVLGTIAVGISLCLIYVKSNKLWTVIVLHFMLNCCSVIYYFSYSDDVYKIARIWPIPMIIVCVITLIVIKANNKTSATIA